MLKLTQNTLLKMVTKTQSGNHHCSVGSIYTGVGVLILVALLSVVFVYCIAVKYISSQEQILREYGMKKILGIFLFVMLSIGLIIAGIVCMGEVQAETALKKPDILDFTLRFVDNSYDVAPIYSTDPFTGETVLSKEGYRVENKTIDVKIKNQSFNRYVDSQGNHILLQYDIRWKGHFDDYWHEYSSRDKGYYLGASNQIMDGSSLLYPNAPYTEITYFGGTYREDSDRIWLGNVPDGGKIDFQVQAFIGYYTRVEVPPDLFSPRTGERLVFTGESSGWSKTKTITFGVSDGENPDNTPSSPSQPSGPSQSSSQSEVTIGGFNLTELGLLIALCSVVVALTSALMYNRTRGKQGLVRK